MTAFPDWQGSGVRKYIQTVRIGSYVQLHVHLLKKSNIVQNDVVATLPPELRPKDAMDLPMCVLTAGSAIGCGMLSVHPDGSVVANTPVSDARWITSTVGYLL